MLYPLTNDPNLSDLHHCTFNLPPPHPYFYHYYISLFIYLLNQFTLSLTLYFSLLSLTISPLTYLISYSLSSPLLSCPLLSPPLLSSPLLSSPILSYHFQNINVVLLGCRSRPSRRGGGE